MIKCLFSMALVLSVLYFSSVPAFDYTVPKAGYSLLRALELSELVVAGEVKDKVFVYRDNMLGGRVRMITTDIVVTVDKIIRDFACSIRHR